jgi:glutaredoxin
MSFQDHLKTCPYCKAAGITVTKGASYMDVKVAKLRELGKMIRGR